jgi:hypothetical protein
MIESVDGFYGGIAYYCVADCVFLFCGDDAAGALCGVQRALAADDSLAGSSGSTARLGPNLCDGVPVAHFGCEGVCVWMCVDVCG